MAYTPLPNPWKNIPHVGDLIDAIQTGILNASLAVKKEGSLVGSRPTLNFHEGTNILLTVADDSGDDEVDITVTVDDSGAVQFADLVLRDVISNLPSASIEGRLFFSTDESKAYRDNSSTWDELIIGGAPPGSISLYGGLSAPTGYLMCDGSAISKSTYADLYAALSASKGTFTVTIATPAVVTLSSHGFIGGEQVYLTTTDTLPTGLAADTNYWVIYIDGNTFNLASSQANYQAATKIATSGSQAGTHSLFQTQYGISGSTNFLVPDFRGRVPVGASGSGGKGLVQSVGLADGVSQANRNISHSHFAGASGAAGGARLEGDSNQALTVRTTGDTDNTDYPAFQTVNYIIKT